MGLKPCYILFNPIIRVLTNFLPGHWPQIKYFHCIVVQRKLCTCSAAAKTTGIRKTLYPGLRCWKWRLRRALELNYKMIISRLRNDLSGRWMYPMLTNANMGHYSLPQSSCIKDGSSELIVEFPSYPEPICHSDCPL